MMHVPVVGIYRYSIPYTVRIGPIGLYVEVNMTQMKSTSNPLGLWPMLMDAYAYKETAG